IARRTPVSVVRVPIERRRLTPGRALAGALKFGIPAETVLRSGYTIGRALPKAVDLVISAGGDTLAANAAAACLYGAPNIFCGTLRHLPPEAFSLVVSSYARHAGLPRHLVAL